MRLFVVLLGVFLYFNVPVCSAAYYTFKLADPVENYSMKYNGEDVYISFALPKKNPDRLFVSIYNKTGAPITVKWPTASLIFSGKAHRVLPASQNAAVTSLYAGARDTSIPPATALEEVLFAEGSISYEREPAGVNIGFGWGRWGGGDWGGGWLGFDDFVTRPGWYGTWRVTPFFPAAKKDIEKANLLGQTLGIFLTLEINGKEESKRFDFAITEISTDKSPGSFGASVAGKEELTIKKNPKQIEKGVLIMALTKKSAAKDAGLLVGDNIIKVDATNINDIEDFVQTLNNKKAGETISITYLRDGKISAVTVKLKKM